MNLAFVVSSTDVSFGNYHTRVVYFQYDNGMNIIINPQDIADFDILEGK